MSINVRKNKRVKFGLFKSESAAQKECEKREATMPQVTASFHTMKLARTKDGKKSWLAYCLIPKKGR